MVQFVSTLSAAVRRAIEAVFEGLVEALPRLVTGLVFLTLAYVGVKAVLGLTRSALRGVYPEDQTLVVDLAVTVIGLFLWFGVGLALLKIVGMGDVAASLGTATGFLALGVSYALSGMLEDTVAGVYLLRDPDFNPGDRVEVGSVVGEVRAIELRKSRLRTDDDDVVVLANSDVEGKWRRIVD